MPITYAGVDVSPPAGGQDALSGYYLDFRIREADHPAYLTSGVDSLPISHPPSREAPRIGVLRWPNDICRWATFHTLLTTRQIEAVRTAIGSSITAKDLVIDDGNRQVTAPMWLLTTRAVSDRPGAGFYLCTFVDSRFWYNQNTGSAPSELSIASWSGLIGNLVGSVGASATVPTIASGYGAPTARRWALGNRPALIMADAAARTAGTRYTRTLAGVGSFSLPATAIAADAQRDTDFGDLILSGGRVSVQDINYGVPESVTVVFGGTAVSSQVVTLASLALSDYGSYTGVAGFSAQVYGDLDGGSSGTDLLNYANQAATDYYLWALGRTEASYRGILGIPPNGLDDAIEWVQLPGRQGYVTRVLRRPISDRNLWGFNSTALTENGGAVTDCCLSLTTSSGVVVGATLTVQRTDPVTGVKTCVADSQDCCVCTACDGVTLPDVLYSRVLSPCGPGLNDPAVLYSIGPASQTWNMGSYVCEYCCITGPRVNDNPTLTLTFSNKTGGCSCLPDTLTLLGDVPDDVWSASTTTCEGNRAYFVHDCSPNVGYVFEMGNGASEVGITFVSYSCDPFQIVYDVHIPGACGGVDGSFRATITVP